MDTGHRPPSSWASAATRGAVAQRQSFGQGLREQSPLPARAEIEAWLGVEPGGQLRLRHPLVGLGWSFVVLGAFLGGMFIAGALANLSDDFNTRVALFIVGALPFIPLCLWVDHHCRRLRRRPRVVADGLGLRVVDCAGEHYYGWEDLVSCERALCGWRVAAADDACRLGDGLDGSQPVLTTIRCVLAQRHGAPAR